MGLIESVQLSKLLTNVQLTVKDILNWSGLSVKAANESKRKFSSSNSQLQRILLLTNTY